MTQRIKTYEDIDGEKRRLLALLKTQEEQIKIDIAGVQKGLEPVGNAMKTLNKVATRDNTGPVMNFGLEMGIDLFVRKFLLARAGWLTKIIVPYIVKNYSSHIIAEEKRDAFVDKIRGFFTKIRPSVKPVNQPKPTHSKITSTSSVRNEVPKADLPSSTPRQ